MNYVKCIAIIKNKRSKNKGCRCNKPTLPDNDFYCNDHKSLPQLIPGEAPEPESNCRRIIDHADSIKQQHPQAPQIPPEPEKVGEGTYGCVFYPAMPCKPRQTCREGDNRCTKGVGKLMTESAAKKQLAEFDNIKLDQIDPEGTFHIRKPHICQADPSYRDFNSKRDECKHATRGYNHLLIYDNGGIGLNNALKSKTYTDRQIELGLLNVFYGIYKMNTNGSYHLDLKSDNVVIMPGGAGDIPLIRLIDFGLSRKWKQDNLVMNNNLYCNAYPVWPLELSLGSIRTIVGGFDRFYNKYVEGGGFQTLRSRTYYGIVRRYYEDAQTLIDEYMRSFGGRYEGYLLRDPRFARINRFAISKADVHGLGYLLELNKKYLDTYSFDHSLMLHPNPGLLPNNGVPVNGGLSRHTGTVNIKGQEVPANYVNGVRWSPKQAFKEYKEYLLAKYIRDGRYIRSYQ